MDILQSQMQNLNTDLGYSVRLQINVIHGQTSVSFSSKSLWGGPVYSCLVFGAFQWTHVKSRDYSIYYSGFFQLNKIFFRIKIRVMVKYEPC